MTIIYEGSELYKIIIGKKEMVLSKKELEELAEVIPEVLSEKEQYGKTLHEEREK